MATKFEIEKFNGNNFSLWKLKMKAILRKDKCLAAIGERPAEVTDDSKWDEMDGNAIANLHLALADGVLSSIEEKKSAKEIWDHLARLYEARSLHNKNFLKRKLYALRMTESTSVTEHVNNLNTLFSQLTSLSCKIDSQERAEILLQSLPDSYDQVIINLTSNVLSDYLVFDDVAAAILEEENRRNNREDRQTSSNKWRLCCNDHELKIIGIGSIMVKMHDGTVRTIQDVRHVKGLKKNLLSLGQLDDLGCKDAEASVASHSPSHRVAVSWHQKLGHMSEHGMKILVERKLIPGLTKVSLPFYEYCVISKQHRQKFKTSNSRSVYVLELVHSDVWQASVYPIKKKSGVFEVFKVYKEWVKLDSGKKIKSLRTDNGGEYIGDEFDAFCK
ncbi:gag-pol polyprotein, partial [Tanacetum coccineum]